MNRFIVILLFALLSAVGWGAMTRNNICVEQSRFNQATTFQSGTTTYRGCTVWLPYDFDNNIWQAWVLHDHLPFGGSTDNVACWELFHHFTAKFYAGTYIPAIYDHATYGRPTELAYSAAWADLNSRNLATASTGWHTSYTASNRTMTITVPANTTRLYVYAVPQAGATATVAITGSGSLTKTTLNLAGGGDFGTDHTGLLSDNYILLATNCGEAQIGITRSAGSVIIAGFIAINDNATAQPDTGVYDPTTVKYMDTGTLTTGNSFNAEGPLYFQFTAGSTDAFLWGMGHWTGAQTLTGESQTAVLTTNISASNAITFTDNTWVRTVGSEFTRTLTGNIQVKNGAAAAASVGTYSSVYVFTPSGLKITNTHTMDADAVTEGLKIDGVNYGGYAGKWNVNSSFTKGHIIGGKTWTTTAGPYTDSYSLSANATGVKMYSQSLNAILEFTCDSYCYNAAATSGESPIKIFHISAGTFPKIYKFMSGSDDVVLADGDILQGVQYRRFYPLDNVGKTGVLGNQPYDFLGNSQ